jgi:hypothetical protein
MECIHGQSLILCTLKSATTSAPDLHLGTILFLQKRSNQALQPTGDQQERSLDFYKAVVGGITRRSQREGSYIKEGASPDCQKNISAQARLGQILGTVRDIRQIPLLSPYLFVSAVRRRLLSL